VGELKVFRSKLDDDNRWISHELVAQSLNTIAGVCRVEADKWYFDLEGNPIAQPRPFDQRAALIHSEVSEAFEGWRKNLMDSHLPQRKALEVELADALIRILDVAADNKFDIGGAVVEKLLYNRQREDHTNSARLGDHGKKV
jgi:hypothetical protein